MQPAAEALWGIYLVDVFDNMLAARGEAGLRPARADARARSGPAAGHPRPGRPQRDDAVVFMADVYQGGGLRGVPRGAVKALRLFTYHFSYQGMGGPHQRSAWTAPGTSSGCWARCPSSPTARPFSACRPTRRSPCSRSTARARPLQIMRSWFTAMPGEVVSCVGCHETQNSVAAPATRRSPRGRTPAEITPWHGPPRGLQLRARSPARARPALRRLPRRPPAPTARPLPDLRGDRPITAGHQIAGNVGTVGGKFSPCLCRAAPVRAPPGHRGRHPPARPDGVPRRQHRARADAPQGAPRRAARRRGLGPADHLDRPERPLPRHLARDRRRPGRRERRRPRGAGHAAAVHRRGRGPRADPPGSQRPEPSRDPDRPATAIARPAPRPTLPGWPFDAAEAARRQGRRGCTQDGRRPRRRRDAWSWSASPPGVRDGQRRRAGRRAAAVAA